MDTSYKLIFRYILVVVFASIVQPTAFFSSHTYVGKYFGRHELKTVQVGDWMGCIMQCHDEPLCVSYNYHVENNSCWLNNHGIERDSELDDELVDNHGWVFQQLRPVTMSTNKIPRKSSCPCNCGASHQCYPAEPGIGDVPEKAATSCQDILRRRGSTPDGAYYLKQNVHRVFCKMTPIQECGSGDGGWTLVMKINGNNTTFKYDADLWKTFETYQDEHGIDLSEQETKLKTYSSVSFQEMCLGMKTSNSTIQWLQKGGLPYSTQMYAIFGVPQQVLSHTQVLLNTWKKLLKGSLMDDSSTKEGFNVQSDNNGGNVRIGIIGYKSSENQALSLIGYGAGGPNGTAMDKISCGNVFDNQVIPAFGYILVR